MLTGAQLAIAISAIISHYVRQSREDAYSARLKQLMIERGFSADEIERIIHATPPTTSDRNWEHLKDLNQGRRAG